MNPPNYFLGVAASAQKLWEQLDADPVLKGPWRQLFVQVQSPRHVLSELLQNADDAGAKSASVKVVNNEFVFEHNGEDFTGEQLQSLCRFGFSNKRNLHTIGFRGVGFKSTFSLGAPIRIQTPSLDVLFERERFTFPVWNPVPTATQLTRITVPFSDAHRLAQLRKNFAEWASSPVSLLFFRHLETVTVETQTVRKEVLGNGPIAGSFRIRLTGASSRELLLIQSNEEAFPESVVQEIRQEREADALNLPPCSVDLVLGLEGKQRLFVVLPSGTDVDLPFSINAPFLQDPARQRIKEPEVSACNRWLLQRAGKLAGEALAAWLENESLTAAERAKAYQLLRGPVPHAADLSTSASKNVLDAMLAAIEDRPIILTADNQLTTNDNCTALPSTLHQVWDAKDLTALFSRTGAGLISPAVDQRCCQVLESHGWIENISSFRVIEVLKTQPCVPKPSSWLRLQIFWEWVEQNSGWDWQGETRKTLRIVPVSGKPFLCPGAEVIRLSFRGQQLSDDDWNFISDFAFSIDQDWLEQLGKLKSKDREKHPALKLLEKLDLDEASQVDRIAAEASRRLLARGKMPLIDCVRIAHIFAALNATVPDDFRYVTEDLHLRSVCDHPVVFDKDGEVELIAPTAWASQHLLHPDYGQNFTSCTKDRWFEWVYSSKSKLHAFIPIHYHPVACT